jgi:acyl-CoA thioesterase
MKSPTEIVKEMLSKDSFSAWLGLEIIEIREGYCKLKMIPRSEMFNGHETIHGGITYSISDSALAFAANSRGQKAVSIETNIAHISPVFLGDELTVECTELNCGKTIARYESKVTNQSNKLVARFTGTVFRTSENW